MPRECIIPRGTPLGRYVALKMNGEAGEFAEHVAKPCATTAMPSRSRPPRTRTWSLLVKESATLWYLSAADESAAGWRHQLKNCKTAAADALRGPRAR